MVIPIIKKSTPPANKNIPIVSGKKLEAMIIVPNAIKKYPPTLCVFFHTLSLDKVQGFFMPMNQLGFIFFKKYPIIIIKNPTKRIETKVILISCPKL